MRGKEIGDYWIIGEKFGKDRTAYGGEAPSNFWTGPISVLLQKVVETV